jgi:hypothetical protein
LVPRIFQLEAELDLQKCRAPLAGVQADQKVGQRVENRRRFGKLLDLVRLGRVLRAQDHVQKAETVSRSAGAGDHQEGAADDQRQLAASEADLVCGRRCRILLGLGFFLDGFRHVRLRGRLGLQGAPR